MSSLLVVAIIVGVHGVRGLVKIKSFTEVPQDFLSYGPLSQNDGETFPSIKIISTHKSTLICQVDGLHDRDAAETLKGTKLCVSREALPLTQEDEFYIEDLKGLKVYYQQQLFGSVTEVVDYGAGPIIEIEKIDRNKVLIPFQKSFVPEIHPEEGGVTLSDTAMAFLSQDESDSK